MTTFAGQTNEWTRRCKEQTRALLLNTAINHRVFAEAVLEYRIRNKSKYELVANFGKSQDSNPFLHSSPLDATNFQPRFNTILGRSRAWTNDWTELCTRLWAQTRTQRSAFEFRPTTLYKAVFNVSQGNLSFSCRAYCRRTHRLGPASSDCAVETSFWVDVRLFSPGKRRGGGDAEPYYTQHLLARCCYLVDMHPCLLGATPRSTRGQRYDFPVFVRRTVSRSLKTRKMVRAVHVQDSNVKRPIVATVPLPYPVHKQVLARAI